MENKIEKQHRNMKYRLLFMWLYVFVLYVPFYIMMLERHSVSYISLSVIGWFTGGLHYIALFMFLTLPFGLYLIFFLNRHFVGNYRWLNIGAVVSAAFMVIGSFIPLGMGEFLYHAHVITSISSSIIFMLIILILLILYACKSKHKWLYFALCGAFVVALAVGFMVLFTSALYQFTATLSFMLILLVVNTVSVRRFLKNNTLL